MLACIQLSSTCQTGAYYINRNLLMKKYFIKQTVRKHPNIKTNQTYQEYMWSYEHSNTNISHCSN